ncbi:MAG: hypothetical protein ACOYMG_06160, partial [Candidatus Methylumidiphilus sp.]
GMALFSRFLYFQDVLHQSVLLFRDESRTICGGKVESAPPLFIRPPSPPVLGAAAQKGDTPIGARLRVW